MSEQANNQNGEAQLINPEQDALAHQNEMHSVSNSRTDEIIRDIGAKPKDLPIIGKLNPRYQYGLSAGLLAGGLGLAVLVASTGFLRFSDYQARTEVGTRLEMLTQRVLAATQYTVTGNVDAFNKLQVARKDVETNLNGLTDGVEGVSGMDVAQVKELNALVNSYKNDVLPLVDRVLDIGPKLADLGANSAAFDAEMNKIAANAERLAILLQSTGAPELHVTAAFQLQQLSERLRRSATILLNSSDQMASSISADVLAQLNETFPSFAGMFGSTWKLDGGNLTSDGVALNDVFDQVDAFAQTYSGNATVFVVDGNDFRRISTSVTREDGSRAVGTMLGEAHPALNVVKEGGSYVGQAILFGRPYGARYDAIKDESGKVIGILYIGYDISSGGTSSQALSEYAVAYRNMAQTLNMMRYGDERSGVAPVNIESGMRIIDDMGISLSGLEEINKYVNENASSLLDARRSLQQLTLLTEAALLNATQFTNEMRAQAEDANGTIYFSAVFLLLAVVGLALIGVVSNRLTRQESWETSFQKTKNEKDIISFMEDILPLEMGDLTVQFNKDMESMEGVTGGIRNSVQEAVLSLHDAVSTVKDTAQDVSSVVTESVENTNKMRLSNEEQTQEISQVSTRVTGLAQAIQVVTARTKQAAEATASARSASDEGARLVQETNSKMSEIRQQMQDVLKSVKNLGETSHEIVDIVNTIEQITDRTQVLAVNASLEAAKAGAAGSGFSVIATEVNRLAEQSAEALRTVTALVQRVQGETGVTIRIVEESTSNVVEGAHLANDANVQLSKISKLSSDLSTIMDDISVQTTEQSESAQDVLKNVDRLSALSGEFVGQVEKVVEDVSSINDQMSNLKSTVDTFQTR